MVQCISFRDMGPKSAYEGCEETNATSNIRFRSSVLSVYLLSSGSQVYSSIPFHFLTAKHET